MNVIAPNVSAICGTAIAAQLLALAGGMAALMKIPSCNLQVMGQQKITGTGFSTASTLKHTGVIYMCDLVQNTPPEYRTKAMRLVANKCVSMRAGRRALPVTMGACPNREHRAFTRGWWQGDAGCASRHGAASKGRCVVRGDFTNAPQ